MGNDFFLIRLRENKGNYNLVKIEMPRLIYDLLYRNHKSVFELKSKTDISNPINCATIIQLYICVHRQHSSVQLLNGAKP